MTQKKKFVFVASKIAVYKQKALPGLPGTNGVKTARGGKNRLSFLSLGKSP